MPLSVNSFLNEVEEIKNKVTALSSKKNSVLGAETAYQFLINFDWDNYKEIRRNITSAYQKSLPTAKLNRHFKNK